MCRSCHLLPENPDAAGFNTDCANCHVPETTPPSILPLLPTGKILPTYTFGPGVPAGEQAAWIARFEEGLESSYVGIADEPGSAPVTIRVEVEIGEGRTDSGAAFLAAAARATFTLHRVRIEVRSAPAVGRDREELARKALADLADRLAARI